MARILGSSKVRRELAKLASRSARLYVRASHPDQSDDMKERLERAYIKGFQDGSQIAERLLGDRSQ